ncbi:MAG: hypothetical protein LPK88_12785 [Alphaproteobacteria bacterium]|nr:hypothetical protein [Alphaproteobacteria bacterium]MDX5417174.1 hypothetical protein [Alphaproteobacteria bacterium]MDX5494611.1 hypothetical protein [Alphaproteobacteria bacterium]
MRGHHIRAQSANKLNIMMENRQKGARTGDAAASRREASARGAALGRELRQIYRDVAQEPIPAEFRKLLEQLDSSDGK